MQPKPIERRRSGRLAELERTIYRLRQIKAARERTLAQWFESRAGPLASIPPDN